MDEFASDDPVATHETIARFTHPGEWDGEHLAPDSILCDDLMMADRGWSVQRMERTSSSLANYAASQAKRDPTTVELAVARVEVVRSVLDQEKARCFFVIEDKLPDNVAHAVVFGPRGMKKGEVRKRRAMLIDILNRKPMAGAFTGPT